jgi:hypothetical protein
MQRKVDDSLYFPKPNVKKADSFYINFGECLNAPQISFFSRINDLGAVKELLKNEYSGKNKPAFRNGGNRQTGIQETALAA